MMLDLPVIETSEPEAAAWTAPPQRSATPLHPIFDRALALTLLAKALAETAGTPALLAQRLGLAGQELHRFVAYCGWPQPDGQGRPATACPAEPDEQGWLRDLLARHAAPASPIAPLLAGILARRAMEANHLWEDLGLPDRATLHQLMHRHFPELAAANTQNMRWKRFFYRTLCEAEGLSHCTSPTCSACADVDQCFETGSAEHRIAQSKQAPAAGPRE